MLGVLLSLQMAVAQSGDGLADLKPLYWLSGNWVQHRNGAVIQSYEHWTKVNDSLFQATSYRILPTGDTVVTETIELALNAGALYYTPTAKGQNDDQPIPFRLTEHKDMSWTFENPQHDFPKRITYTLLGYDTLQAVVSDGVKEVGFTFVRHAQPARFEMGEGGEAYSMRKFWLLSYLSGPKRDQSQAEAQQIQQGHMAHLNKLWVNEKSCVAGPTDGQGEVRGFVVFKVATREEAEWLAAQDPAVVSGRLAFTLEAWWAMEGAVLK